MNVRAAFYDELEKIASWGSLVHQGLEHIGTPGRAAALGGVIGAARGAAKAEPGERQSGAISGALRGAAIGGASGFVGRHALNAKLLKPELSAGQALGEGLRESGRSIKRFAKREAHGLTGAYGKDPTALGYMTPENLERARKLEVSRAAIRSQGAHPFVARSAQKDALDAIAGHEEEAKEFARRQSAGITSLPGTFKGLARDPRGTGRALLRAAGGSSAAGKAMMAAPVVFAVPEIMKGDESSTGGPTLGRKLLATGANVAGNVLTAGLPAASQVIAGGALDMALAPKRRIAPAAAPRAVDSAEAT